MKVNTVFFQETRFLTIITLLLIINEKTFSQNIGEVSVKKWKDDKKSAFSFSFDDSFVSHYSHARPVLNQYGFKGTFYLSTSVIDDGADGAGTWNNFRQMYAEGHEMGAHTVNHKHLKTLPIGDIDTRNTIRYEVYRSKERIEDEIGNQCITLAYPFAEYNSNVLQAAKEFFEAGRADGADPNDASLSYANFFTLTSKELLFNIPRNSVSADDDEYADFQNSVNSTVTQGKWLTLLAHEVVPFANLSTLIQNGAWYPMTKEWLDDACQFIKSKSDNNNMWVETIANVTRYIKERDGYTTQLLSVTDNEINLNITDALDNEIYNYPLTVDITVPSTWTQVVFQQGNRSENLTPFISSGKTVVRTEIIPDGGPVKLTGPVVTPTFAYSGLIQYHNAGGTPVNHVSVNLSGPNGLHLSINTDTNGQYSFDGLLAGEYIVSFSKVNGWGGVNATDALETLRYFTGLTTLDSLQLKAANVNNSGGVNATDALLILNRFAGVLTSFPIPDWIFDTSTINFTVQESDVVHNLKVVAAGEVNKSFIPAN